MNCRNLLLFALGLLLGCANPIPPEGGPKDTQPPRLDTLRSTRNFQTHFKKQDIVLAFDEWVELRDVFTQVVISPPLGSRPNIVRRKKTVRVIFADDEVLRDSATYVINFGQAIGDLTERNVNPLVFVFSTGSYIDSLSVEGTITDAWTGKPVEKALFMLYENLADSVIRTERPFYFAMTDKEGMFRVGNVKSGTFKAVALNDQNLNFRLDGETEQVGFLDSNLVLVGTVAAPATDAIAPQPDSLRLDSSAAVDLLRKTAAAPPPSGPTAKVNLQLFTEGKPLFLRSKDTGKYGLVSLGFNQPPTEARVSFDSVGQTVVIEKERDTLRLWYHHPVRDTAWRVFVQRDTSTDTILVKSGLRAGFLASPAVGPGKLAPATKLTGQPARLAPGQAFTLRFNHPLASIRPDSVLLLEDSARTRVLPRLRIDSLDRRTLVAEHDWREGRPYELLLLPGAVADLFGLRNADTLALRAIAAVRKDFGSMTLRAVGLDSAKAYILQLRDRLENPPLHAWTVSGQPRLEVKLELLPPGTYTAELIEDLDRNGQWTTGSYDLRRQPERLTRKVLEELRANWELDAEVGF